jgi:hypothetical protein
MELSPYWETVSCAVTQQFLNILLRTKFHYHVHMIPPPFPIPSQYHLILSLKSILILFTQLRFILHSGLFPPGFPTNILQAFLLIPIPSTFPVSLVFHYLISLIMFGEDYTLWSHSLSSYYPTFCHFIPPRSKYTLQSSVLKHPQSIFYIPVYIPHLMSEINISHPYRRRQNNSVAWVSERAIPTERPPLVREVNANFCG